MKIAELSQRSGVSIGTIKFYIREGLLARGMARMQNQAEYGEEHVVRLKLIRALKEVGQLSTKAVREIVAAIEGAPDTSENVFNLFLERLRETRARPALDPEVVARTKHELMDLLTKQGWLVDETNPSLDDLAEAWVALLDAWDPEFNVRIADITILSPYVLAMEQLAEREIPTQVVSQPMSSHVFAQSIVGTVLFEPILTAIRRLAHSSRITKILTDDSAEQER